MDNSTKCSEKKAKPCGDDNVQQAVGSDATSAPQAKSQAQASTVSNEQTATLVLNESTGDIFSAPANALMIHACNCQGSWAAGIAAAFKKHYPEAFKVYAKHCHDHKDDSKSLLGTALLIPPSSTSHGAMSGKGGAPRINGKASASSGDGKGGKQHFVGCLFTSDFYGKKRGTPAHILAATAPAMEDLLRQAKGWNESHEDGEKVGEVRMCKINSGLFHVPWEDTAEVLEGIEVDNSSRAVKRIEVVERERG